MGPVDTLKIHLGRMGRADFKTDSHGADLVWLDERYAVIQLSCVWEGCPDHTTEKDEREHGPRIQKRMAATTKLVKGLRDAGWRVMTFFDCEYENIERRALNIVDELAEWRPREKADFNAMALAELATLDGVARSSRDHWKEIIQVIVGLRNEFTKGAVASGVSGEKWDADIFEDLWDTLKHHGIVWWDTNGFHPGDLLKVVKRDLGI
jgi:G:T-mismatch repair DNA endonuclease (very short patch repair protein)